MKQHKTLSAFLESCHPDKLEFLESVIEAASDSYDYAVTIDARQLQGELYFRAVTEHRFYNGTDLVIGKSETSGGRLRHVLSCTLREEKRLHEFE